MPDAEGTTGASAPPRTVYTSGLSVRVSRRTALFIGVATGRYWTWGASHTRWHSDLRVPFAQAGIVRALPNRGHRVRLTFMGWRGADHAPSPDLREWRWPTAASGEREAT